ncbi:oxysterol-binding protein-related protein 1 isoform X3 [Scyliorhinus canicula]|uniref:oxysterol-binding protein-related protein 1 isoform X3 n=1 Tax=Scyliorhinus canicula TaxID=7830 RepID=UPI0018F773EF|nr:oxysterol-binding protein-related protein 1 isoform X3 [Scyliorhinus canicula]
MEEHDCSYWTTGMSSETEDQVLRGAEEQLLHLARNGISEEVKKLLDRRRVENLTFNINCKGRAKSNFGWTPLHLACYFGHKDVVEELLKADADVNVVNDVGDSPLHRAAFTGRKELVMLLLQRDADAAVINGDGQTARAVTQDQEIRCMLEAAEMTQQRKSEELLLAAAREGDVAGLTTLLNKPNPPNVNCVDKLGNTPLHCAAYRGQKQAAIKLLKCGADISIKNNNNQVPLDLARSREIKLILGAKPSKGMCKMVQRFEGPLFKRSRFFGWNLVWVVLEHGVLSWFHSQSDAKADTYRQGCKNLTQATCTVKSTDERVISIKCFDDSIHIFKVHLKGAPAQTGQKWLQAIGEHSAYSTHYCSADQHSDEDDEDLVSVECLQESFQTVQTCQQKLEKEVASLLSMVEGPEIAKGFPQPLLQKVKDVTESSRIACVALNNCVLFISKQEAVHNLRLAQEQEKNKILSEALQTLACEHHELEQSLVKGSPPHSVLSDDEFYDALSDSDSVDSLSGFETVTSQSTEDEPLNCSNTERSTMSEQQKHSGGPSQANGITKYRTSLPAPMFSRNDFSIWSILRKCIGMELSKIAMPVIFNEPLSFLQRLTEYMEHTYLIHEAIVCHNSLERMQCVAAFAVSAVASQWERTGKPFNPLLGETYEMVRQDLGFKLISEQVSHHPPISAFHAEGLTHSFVFHGSIYPKLKFWGKSVEAEPKGIMTLELFKDNEAYTWTNPTCCVHNIIVGQLWIEQYGNVEITNHKSGEKCILNFKPCGLFGKELHKVEGYIQDKSKKKLCAVYGKWTECLWAIDPSTFEAYKKNDKKNTEEKKLSKSSVASEKSELDEMPLPDNSESVQVIPGSRLLWKIAPRPSNSQQMYNFTNFAMSLNELDKEMENVIAPTDCRFRPDIKAMENGDIDLASEEKKRLEEKQRAARKQRTKTDNDWKNKNQLAEGPRWFHQGPNPYTGASDWLCSGGYWDRNYSHCNDIY